MFPFENIVANFVQLFRSESYQWEEIFGNNNGLKCFARLKGNSVLLRLEPFLVECVAKNSGKSDWKK